MKRVKFRKARIIDLLFNELSRNLGHFVDEEDLMRAGWGRLVDRDLLVQRLLHLKRARLEKEGFDLEHRNFGYYKLTRKEGY